MPPSPRRSPRLAARAVIQRAGFLLVIRLSDRRGEFFLLPGGGQEHGETLEETVRRECREELGTDIEVLRFALLREYIGSHHGFATLHRSFHQVEALFECRLLGDPIDGGEGGDRRQVGWAWLPLSELEKIPFYPKVILPFFREGGFSPDRPYLGDCN